MTPPPLVSIITPFLNAEAFFEEMIESVIAQTYGHWELMLVDDGSTDSSTAIAQRYAAQYPGKIRYLDHEGHQNWGKSTSRNLGIQQSQGDYIALLDADDIFLPQKLEKQVAILETHSEAGMIYGPTLYWYGWTGQDGDRRRDRIAALGLQANSLVQPPHLMTLYLRKGGVVPCTCGLLVRRTLVDTIGGFDETIQHMYEDQVFIVKVCLKAPVFVEQDCWDQYRQHDASSSSVAIREGEYHPLKLNAARLKFLTWLGDYLAAENIQDQLLMRAYQRALWPYSHPQLAKITLPAEYLVKRVLGSLATAVQRVLPV
ncbi:MULTISPECIES: glycosyltransferase family A protein [Cyanophyceae]|uniref:glycosyltransferase family 2 protein n=1 Tax=Cyanophyceae TaxID=3028117 RepID=UPI001684C7A7|nr:MULTISPECIES: glycosyltransferase family A protein [Cyanophyceae]MBD1918178.1 glycosyltransferase family 2 protein [Phormidium sp. FACHB-77]MBD2030210.1 glycosyltransferase family 2 protein [Phormidium sp. FACHB-322]MBD2051418.1 glycosyltransferase family 2 protein [Leptolyngbya sp. FACHB-60]